MVTAAGLLLPMTGEAAAAISACAKLGAIFCPTFSGYAADALVTRFSDCNVKVVITADTYQRRGRDIDLPSALLVSPLPSYRERPRVVIVSRGMDKIDLREGGGRFRHPDSG